MELAEVTRRKDANEQHAQTQRKDVAGCPRIENPTFTEDLHRLADWLAMSRLEDERRPFCETSQGTRVPARSGIADAEMQCAKCELFQNFHKSNTA